MFPSHPPHPPLPDGWSHRDWLDRRYAESTPAPWRSDEDFELLERAIAFSPPLPFDDPDTYPLGLADTINPAG